MRKNKSNPAPVVEEEVPVDNTTTQIFETKCPAWNFLPGLSYVGPNGLLQCMLVEGHEDEHELRIDILSSPGGSFKITWTESFTKN